MGLRDVFQRDGLSGDQTLKNRCNCILSLSNYNISDEM